MLDLLPALNARIPPWVIHPVDYPGCERTGLLTLGWSGERDCSPKSAGLQSCSFHCQYAPSILWGASLPRPADRAAGRAIGPTSDCNIFHAPITSL